MPVPINDPWVVPEPFIAPYPQLQTYPPNSIKLITPVSEPGGVWSEKIGNEAPGVDAVSVDASSFTSQVEVPWSQRSVAMSRILGYQYVDGTKLKRVLPIAHPFFEFARCRRIARAQGIGPRGDGPIEPVDLGPAFLRPYYANYSKLRMDLVFETLPFAFKTDEQVTKEYERYTYVRTEPGYDSYFIEGDMFRFDADATFPTSLNDQGVRAFASGRNLPISVGQVLCTWYDVPLEFVQYQSIYKNINFGIGKINNTAIFGYPKYTLLMDTPQIELRPNPLPPDISTDVSLLANITFRFHYFEPKPLGTGVTLSLGHNMALYKKTRTWFPASLVDNATGKADKTTRLYEGWDFGKLFAKPDGTTLTASY